MYAPGRIPSLTLPALVALASSLSGGLLRAEAPSKGGPEPLKRLPATLNKFHPFHGGLLEHTLSVAWSCLQLVEKYTVHYTELKPPLNKDLVVAGAILHALISTLPAETMRPRVRGNFVMVSAPACEPETSNTTSAPAPPVRSLTNWGRSVSSGLIASMPRSRAN